MCELRVSHKWVCWKCDKEVLSLFVNIRVGIRVRGLHLVFFVFFFGPKVRLLEPPNISWNQSYFWVEICPKPARPKDVYDKITSHIWHTLGRCHCSSPRWGSCWRGHCDQPLPRAARACSGTSAAGLLSAILSCGWGRTAPWFKQLCSYSCWSMQTYGFIVFHYVSLQLPQFPFEHAPL